MDKKGFKKAVKILEKAGVNFSRENEMDEWFTILFSGEAPPSIILDGAEDCDNILKQILEQLDSFDAEETLVLLTDEGIEEDENKLLKTLEKDQETYKKDAKSLRKILEWEDHGDYVDEEPYHDRQQLDSCNKSYSRRF